MTINNLRQYHKRGIFYSPGTEYYATVEKSMAQYKVKEGYNMSSLDCIIASEKK
jgi:hypothetical protein